MIYGLVGDQMGLAKNPKVIDLCVALYYIIVMKTMYESLNVMVCHFDAFVMHYTVNVNM